MASLLSFSALVEAISRSVAQAQDEVERHQVRNILDYFDADGRPRGITFRVPSQSDERRRRQQEDFYTVPLLALISINVLKIKDVEVKFSVDLTELSEDDNALRAARSPAGVVPRGGAPEPGERKAGFVSPMKTLNVTTATGRRGGKVRVALRVEGSEPSEGAARLLDYLAQLQGVYSATEESLAESGSSTDSPGADGAPNRTGGLA